MTTEVQAKRSVSELISLDTFQGMSDDEIQRLIDYYCEQAVTTAQNNEMLEQLNESSAELSAKIDEAHERMDEMFQRILARNKTIQFGVVGNE